MSEKSLGAILEAESHTEETRSFIKQVRRITRRKFTPEEKVRIVLEGFRRDTPIRDLYRREGIRPGTYYAWLKDFMEAGRERLTRDTTRDATKAEVQELKRQIEGRLQDKKSGSSIPWNKLNPEEEEKIATQAQASPELSPRQLALRLVDKYGCWVSESTVYRILRREGLVKRAEVKGFAAGKEYHRKTRRPNGMWAIDCSYLRVVGWGYYYRLP